MSNIQEQATDKEFLRAIAANEYKVPDDIDAFAFANALLPNFSSADGELRDELSYMILANGLIEKQRLTQEQLETLLTTVLDENHLFYHIGEDQTDSVFQRSFSNLVVAALLYNDAGNPTFPPELIQQTKAALLRYGHEEKDWRGYIEGKGWAHAMAHLADALDECAQNAALEINDRREILELVGELARLPEPLYHEEDIRLARVAYHLILAKQVDDEFLTTWVDSCFVPRDPDVTSWTRGTNAKNFLRSLFFLLHWDGIAPVLTAQIAAVLKQQDEVYLESRST